MSAAIGRASSARTVAAFSAGLLAAVALAGCGGSHKAATTTSKSKSHAVTTMTTGHGSVNVADTTWHCRSSVDLAVVRVALHDQRQDAVHIDRGCKGTIGRLEIVGNGGALGPGGDGVKVHDGAHDLTILGGFIDCGAKRKGKHQDAIQAMGGRNVVFHNLTSAHCANSFMFINSGRHRRGLPTAIRCVGCSAATRNYSIFVGRSVESGAVDGRFSSRVPPKTTALAVRPTLDGNAWIPRSAS
jgi:hypothetical protein